MASREEILADFQVCTGIDDVEIAICHLEGANWSLVEAVNKFLTENSTHPTAAVGPTEDPTPQDFTPNLVSSMDTSPPPLPGRGQLVDMLNRAATMGAGPSGITLADDFFPMASSSAQRTRMLEFNIQYNDRMIHLKVPDHEDIRTLKTLIQAETGVPPCSQELSGFNRPHAPFPFTDRRKLSEMHLPKENVLFLSADIEWQTKNGAAGATGTSDVEPQDFTLSIVDERNNKLHSIKYPPTKTLLNVKMDTFDLTNIPVSRQKWTGWPDGISDELSLAQIGIPREHMLFLNHLSPPQSPLSGPGPSMPIIDLSESIEGDSTQKQDSESDFEEIQPDVIMDDDEDDDMFMAGASSRPHNGRLQPLLPDDLGDEAIAAIRFGEEFGNRYGQPMPHFFPGSLDQAIKESCMQPAKHRKMLAVYLHHDSSVLTNVFCTQALCSDSVTNFLNENFVSFGWDLTLMSNKNRAVDMITRHFGSVAAMSIKTLEIERLPILVLVYRLRGTTEICQIIHGNVTVDELISRLLTAHENYHSQLMIEVREDDERIARDAVKREQDLAFEMSLLADQEKEAQKQREEQERILQEKKELEEKRIAEREKAEIERVKERQRAEILKRLPQEPEKTDKRKLSKLRFRIPTKNTDETEEEVQNERQWIERRFLASNSLKVVFDYLTVEGFSVDDYKVLSSWPRRDLTQLDPEETLEALNLCPQETLTLEEK